MKYIDSEMKHEIDSEVIITPHTDVKYRQQINCFIFLQTFHQLHF